MYDPVNKRFTTIDPIKDGDNYYGYVGNNPVNYVDPLGLYSISQLKDLKRLVNQITIAKRSWITESGKNDKKAMKDASDSATDARGKIEDIMKYTKGSVMTSREIINLKKNLEDLKSTTIDWARYQSVASCFNSTIER